ncbi:UTRA domain-containing protein [Kitasatospora sp. MY 5-36]|uniref:UTRA domain-containing protein n=1 Tax=Kitasatospora sp. MY 5-36 TaxID=1678027 RepID=UPI0006709DBB|nr:UTRA domain-containing protein [Kitasatospora sp. MY 5-36]
MASNTINEDGTILRDAATRYRKATREDGGAHGAFDAETRRSGGTPKAVVGVERGTAPERVAGILGTDASTTVSIRKRSMFDGERLVQLADSYIPTDVAEAAGIEQVDTGVGGIISRMAEAGFAQAKAVEYVQLRPATGQVAELLGVESGTELIEITHIGYTDEGRAVEATVHTLAPGWVLRYDVPLA